MSRTPSRFALFSIAAALLAGSLASCGSDLLNPVTRTWTLQSVAGTSVPAPVPNASPAIVITAATAITSADGSYSITFNGTSDGVDAVVGSDRGHWSISSSAFLFRSSNGVADYIAALDNSTMRLSLPGEIVHSSSQTIPMEFTESQ